MTDTEELLADAVVEWVLPIEFIGVNGPQTGLTGSNVPHGEGEKCRFVATSALVAGVPVKDHIIVVVRMTGEVEVHFKSVVAGTDEAQFYDRHRTFDANKVSWAVTREGGEVWWHFE